MGGAACAKEILCNPPAVARANNDARSAFCKTANARDLKRAKLKGLADLGNAIRGGLSLDGSQIALFHRASAVLDQPKEFNAAYEELRASLIVSEAK